MSFYASTRHSAPCNSLTLRCLALAKAEVDAEVMAIARPLRLWRAQPSHNQSLMLPAMEPQRGWLQMISGFCELTTPAGDRLTLEPGDGLGFDDPAAIGRLTAQGRASDVLLFGLNEACPH